MSNAPERLTFLARVERALRIAYRSAGRGVTEFYNSSNLTFASSIAYYSLLSFFPFVALAGAVYARLIGSDQWETLIALTRNALPSQFDFLTVAMQDLSKATLRFSVLGTVLTVWASMGVFGALTSAVNHAWNVENPLGFFKHKLVAFVMMVCAFVLLMGAILAVSTSRSVGNGALTPTFILVVGLIYYFAPNTRVRLRDVWFGAVLAGLLWHGAFFGFAWYLRTFSRLNLFGTIGTVMAFLVWIYLSAIILLYGVEVTAAYSRLRKNEERRTGTK